MVQELAAVGEHDAAVGTGHGLFAGVHGHVAPQAVVRVAHGGAACTQRGVGGSG